MSTPEGMLIFLLSLFSCQLLDSDRGYRVVFPSKCQIFYTMSIFSSRSSIAKEASAGLSVLVAINTKHYNSMLVAMLDQTLEPLSNRACLSYFLWRCPGIILQLRSGHVRGVHSVTLYYLVCPNFSPSPLTILQFSLSTINYALQISATENLAF